MRIAFISTMAAAAWGGSECLWSEAAAAALEEHHEVAMFTFDWPELPEAPCRLSEAGAQWQRRARGIRAGLESLFPGVVSRWSFRALGRFRPDVVLISMGSTYDAAFSGVWQVARRLVRQGVPYVVLSQSNSDKDLARLDDRRRSIARTFYLQAERTLFLSSIEIAMVQRQLACTLSRACVVHNPVKLRPSKPLRWPGSPPWSLACVARLHAADKGHDLLLEVLAQPRWQQRAWKLEVYGTGPSRRYYECLASHYALDHRVRFHGHVGSIREVWERNHLLVMPSRSEGVPLAMVEALLCGRPPVATDVGGVGEWLEDGSTGFLADAATTRCLAQAMERAWGARRHWRQMGQRAFETVRRKVDPRAGQTLLELLKANPPRRRALPRAG